ncbi:MAG TPA: hypothetical protein PK694_07015 [Rhodospirillales bacterium]|nr:hypothetical protein [Rhodospirillales bacterium]
MARKPNYRFDRLEKDRAKAAKKAERLKARQERSSKVRQPGDEPAEEVAEEVAEGVGETPGDGSGAEPRPGED